jgi:hypothetical protein
VTYTRLIGNSLQLVCGIFPFSFSENIKKAITAHSNPLKRILCDKEDKKLESDLQQPDAVIQIINGAYFKDPSFDWLAETSPGSLFPAETGSAIVANFVHKKTTL